MTTKEFIQKIPEELRLHPLGHCKSLSELVLDPEVWKAVGKKEGWGGACGYCYASTIQKCIKYQVCENSEVIDLWQAHMHQMIDALADGKSLEEYITTL